MEPRRTFDIRADVQGVLNLWPRDNIILSFLPFSVTRKCSVDSAWKFGLSFLVLQKELSP